MKNIVKVGKLFLTQFLLCMLVLFICNNNYVFAETEEQLTYVYLENESVKQNDIQNVVVGLSGDLSAITNAKLVLESAGSGAYYNIDANSVLEDCVFFSFSCDFVAEDVLSLAGISYSNANGQETKIMFAEYAMGDMSFSVNNDVNDLVTVVNENDDISTVVSEALNESETEIYGDDGLVGQETRVAANDNIVIVLDPGHDNKHLGSHGNGLKEEILNLKVALYCKEELEQYEGVTVYMTRNSEACPHPGTTSTNDNAARVDYAQSVGATAYVSIHMNSSTKESPNGAEVFYPNGNYNAQVSSEGANLATQIERQLTALGLYKRGITYKNSGDKTTYPDGSKADYYGVIKRSKLAGFPGIIIEHAFVSNPSDAAFLSSESNLESLGIADATGIAAYYGLKDGPAVETEFATNAQGYKFTKERRVVRCYDSKGTLVTNEFKCDGTYTYFFQADGTAMINRLTYHPDGEHVIYFDRRGHEVFSNFANVRKSVAGDPVNDYCFFDVYGYLYVDVVTYDKEGKVLYYANPYGVLEKGGWFKFSDKVKCADGTPWNGAAGKYGYAKNDCTLETDAYKVDPDGKTCYLQANGAAAY